MVRIGLLGLAGLSGVAMPLRDGGAPFLRATTGARASSLSDEPPAGLTREDWGQVRGAIQASSYQAARVAKVGDAPALVAPNRKQGYGTTFRPVGIEIARQARSGGWRLSLATTTYGYASDLRMLEPTEPVTEKDRVEYRRGPVTEWYVNRPGGLEQGFELQEPGPRRGEPLIVEMTVGGDLQVASSGDGAAFADRLGETQLRYVGLKAWDADARPVTSRMEAADGRLRLVLEAGAARFPVTVDPVFVQAAEFFGHTDSIGQEWVLFGNAVSVSGDTLVVGAPQEDTTRGYNAGAAYVFVRSGTTWTEQAKLIPGPPAHGSFGSSVSLSGDTVVVGEPYAEIAGSFVGSAHVFVRSGTAWVEQAELTASDGAYEDDFGGAVSVSDDTAVIGATPGSWTGRPGRAYVFVRSGTTWTEQQRLFASDGDFSFGASVSTYGDTAVVGTFESTSGGAYVFVRSGTTWTEQAKLTPPDQAEYGYFGSSVSLYGESVVVGEPYAEIEATSLVGSAYVFVRSGTTWTVQQRLLASDGGAYYQFGSSVSVSGGTVALGAPGDPSTGGTNSGSAYAFVRSPGAWTQQAKLTAPAPDGASDYFGASVSVFADTVAVGAPDETTARGSGAGAAYVFRRSGPTWSEQKLTASDGGNSDRFGSSVSVSGGTIVVGAPDVSGPGHGAGGAYVFVRSGTVWSELQKLVPSGGRAWTGEYGSSVSVSGDTAVVGSPPRPPYYDTGSAHVFVRSGTTWSEQQALLSPSGAAEDDFGWSVSISGDTLVVADSSRTYVLVRSGTSWAEQQDLPGYGSVSLSGDTLVMWGGHVFERSGTTWIEQQPLTLLDGAAPRTTVVSGNMVLVGASATGGAGSAHVFARSGLAWTERQKLTPSDGQAYDGFGGSLAVSGGTVVAGAPGHNTADSVDAGSAYVFGEVSSGADLSIAVTDGHTVLAPGQSVTYTVTVANAGPDAVAGAAVSDFFPDALACSTTCSRTGGAACTPGPFAGNISETVNIAPGQSVIYTSACTISPSATGLLANMATVIAPPNVDPFLDNNTSTDTDTLTPSADLAVAVTHWPDSVAPGETLSYQVQVTNLGPSSSTGMSVTDLLPAGVTYVSSTPRENLCAFAEGTLTCGFGVLAPGTGRTMSIEATVDAGTRGVLGNTGSVSGNEPDPVGSNNSDTDTTLVSMTTHFFTVVPCRLVDTRDGSGAPVGGPALAARTTRVFALAGHCGIPSTAQAVALNVTVTQPGGAGNLRLFPAGLTLPLVSTVNYAAGQTRGTSAVIALNADGEIAVYADQASGTTVHVIIDVSGYFE